jgi:hypothetical protein
MSRKLVMRCLFMRDRAAMQGAVRGERMSAPADCAIVNDATIPAQWNGLPSQNRRSAGSKASA